MNEHGKIPAGAEDLVAKNTCDQSSNVTGLLFWKLSIGKNPFCFKSAFHSTPLRGGGMEKRTDWKLLGRIVNVEVGNA